MKKRKPIFMIHKHQATHMHYDVRVEIDGVLKSWALRDITMQSHKPILAIQVADHPFWYRHYEGVIHEGLYGAGPVMVWEKGIYTNFYHDHTGKLLSPSQSLKQGILLLWIEGKKLNGGFLLLRISKKQRWVWIKMVDQFADKRKGSKWNHSVKTNKTIEQIFQEYLDKNKNKSGKLSPSLAQWAKEIKKRMENA